MPVPAHIDTGMPFRRESIEREFFEGKTAVSPATSASRYEDTIFSSSLCSSQSTSTLSSSRENSPSSKAPPPQPTTTKAKLTPTPTTTTTTITAIAIADDAAGQPLEHSKQAARPRPEPLRIGHPFTSQILSPRPYEQIYAEMSYLAGSLHSEALKTAKLIGHYSLIEEALRGEAAVGKHRRRLRKQLSSLKCRIAQASLQEKAIRVRLSELQMEAQSRTTWIQLQQRRMVPDTGPLSAAAASACTSSTFAERASWTGGPEQRTTSGGGGGSSSSGTPSRRKLNAACLEFVPGRIISREQEQPEPEPEGPPADDSSIKAELGAGSRRDGDGDGFRNSGLEYHFERQDAAAGVPNRTAAATDSGRPGPHHRRLSLPSIIFIWPES
ncbi:hypothetical protein ESCO_005362 [Escovopsis weberi]|uniref:Uncharacterized protein n=1 Tax=Escovopsis weberi TaxID=150374 RepID=A0A0M8N5T4_ESCWE|nr:hypothetical protein ESCO_005362 [Escovopsis weberi]